MVSLTKSTGDRIFRLWSFPLVPRVAIPVKLIELLIEHQFGPSGKVVYSSYYICTGEVSVVNFGTGFKEVVTDFTVRSSDRRDRLSNDLSDLKISPDLEEPVTYSTFFVLRET